MGTVIRLQVRGVSHLSVRAQKTQESAALAAVHDHEVVFHWYPWPDDEDDRLFPIYALCLIAVYSVMTFSIITGWGVNQWRG